jgi:hypothetical protein
MKAGLDAAMSLEKDENAKVLCPECQIKAHYRLRMNPFRHE